jgi:hypothetical protein
MAVVCANREIVAALNLIFPVDICKYLGNYKTNAARLDLAMDGSTIIHETRRNGAPFQLFLWSFFDPWIAFLFVSAPLTSKL